MKLAVAWVRQELGPRGLFVVAGVAGLTDVDAITLPTAKLGEVGTIPLPPSVRASESRWSALASASGDAL